MKNIVSGLPGGNNGPKSIVSFDILDSVYSHLYRNSSSIEFKMKNVHKPVCVHLFTFPTSFENDEQTQKELEKSGFKNPYEVLNELYSKINIDPITQEQTERESEFDYLHIQFYTQPPERIKKDLKHIFHNFIIFFCCTNDAEPDDFRILYSNSWFFDYIRGILDTNSVDITDPQNDIQEIGFDAFKTILQGICQFLNIEIPEGTILHSEGNLLIKEEVTAATFEEFITLVSRGDIQENFVRKQSKILLKNFKKGTENHDQSVKGHWNFFESVHSWNSDWKFDPEDAEYFISQMIGENFNFEYPKETYSHHLFPYIQSALGKLNLELMTYDTHGDHYLFFVAGKNDVARILELSELTSIAVNKL